MSGRFVSSQSAFFLTKVSRKDKEQLSVIYLAFSRSNLSYQSSRGVVTVVKPSENRRGEELKSSEDETVWAILTNSPQNRGEYYSIYMEKISWLLNRSLNTGWPLNTVPIDTGPLCITLRSSLWSQVMENIILRQKSAPLRHYSVNVMESYFSHIHLL